MIALALAAALSVGTQPGIEVSWQDEATKQTYCGVLSSIDYRGFAWILPNRSPHFYAIVHTSLVNKGCP